MMPIQLNEEDGGRVFVVPVSDKLAKEDYEHFVPELERLVQQHGRLRLLFDMTGSHGWEAAALLEDTQFAIKHIDRLAMLGETNLRFKFGLGLMQQPSHTPFIFPIVMTVLGLLTGIVQAYIFSILAAVYIAAATRIRKLKTEPEADI